MGPEFKFKIGFKPVKLEISAVIYSRPATGETVSPEICNCASLAFKTVEIIPVAGAKHLWVGEPAVHTVLSEITKVLAPERLPLPTEV